jgi:MFS family permease
VTAPQGQRWRSLAAAGVAVLPVALDGPVLAVAMPVVARGLDATRADAVGVVALPALLLALLGPLGGRLATRYGARRMLPVGLGVLATGSVLSVLADGLARLTAARGLWGVGAALLLPAGLRVVDEGFGPRDRPRAVAIWAGFTGLLVVLGPLLGAGLAAGGRTGVFGAAVPLAVLAGVTVLRLVPCASAPAEQVRTRVAAPVAGHLAVALASAALLGALYRVPFSLLDDRGLSPLTTALALLPAALAGIAVAPRADRLAARWGDPAVTAVGLLAVAAGLVLLEGVGLPAVEAGLVLVGAGSAAAITVATARVLATDPAAGGGVRLAGGAAGVVVLGTGVPYSVAAVVLVVGAAVLLPCLSRSRTPA